MALLAPMRRRWDRMGRRRGRGGGFPLTRRALAWFWMPVLALAVIGAGVLQYLGPPPALAPRARLSAALPAAAEKTANDKPTDEKPADEKPADEKRAAGQPP